MYGLPASYFEKLLWHFLKTRVFGGIFLFFKKETVVLTLSVFGILVLEYLLGMRFWTVSFIALIMLIFGFIVKNKIIGFRHTIIISIIVFIGAFLEFFHMIEFYFDSLSVEFANTALPYIIAGIIFVWFSFNSVMLLVQIAEFFSSTTGLYLLWGSDGRRIFLSPLPQLIAVLILLAGFYLWIKNQQFISLICLIGPLIIFTLVYLILSESGRIVRSTIALFVFFQAYTVVSFVYNLGIIQNIVVWGLITFVSSFFIAQSTAVRVTSTKTGINGMIIVLEAVILLIGQALLPVGGYESVGISFSVWWTISIASTMIAPILFYFYSRYGGKLKRYIKRDKINTQTLFLEMITIVGAMLSKEITKLLSSKIANSLKSLFGREK